MDFEFKMIVLVVALLIVGMLIVGGFAIYGGAKCKELGYREASLGFPVTIYCVKRVEQTDVVLPLKELIK
jgi:hypothetical protein